MLTLEKVRDAYQNAIPARRKAFKRLAHQCLLDASHKNNLQRWYLEELMRLAQDEVYARSEIASQRVEQLIDSGWAPENTKTVDSVYRDMFANFPDTDRDSFSDLYGYIDGAFDNVGLAASMNDKNQYRRRLGQAQVDAAKQFVAHLEAHMESRHPEQQNNQTTVNVHGNVGNFQSGGVSHITQHFGTDLADVVRALEALKNAAKGSAEPQLEEIEQVVDAAIDTAHKPGAKAASVGAIVRGAQDMIRTAGATPAAWNLLVVALSQVGVHLPPLPAIH
jgi:hypothetical protein